MKAQVLLTNILAVAAISAIADTQPNGVTPFDNLRTTRVAEFSATANGASDTKSGCSVDKADGKVTIEDSYYVVESELTDAIPLTVTPNETTTRAIEKFDVTFKASFVDEADLSDAAVGEAKIGFALTSATSASYFCPGDPKGTWTALDPEKGTGTLSVTEDAECTLHVDYDGRVQQARFNIGNFTSEWVAVGAVENNTMAVLGSGSVKSFAGATYDIEAEVVVITPEGEEDPVNVEIPPTAMADIALKLGCDPAKPTEVAEKLNVTNAQNKLTELTNYILFGKVGSDIAATDKPVVEGVALAPKTDNANKVGIKLTGLKVQSVSGAVVSYKLMGRASTTAEWVEVDTASAPSFTFNKPDGTYYYKVVTVITYGTTK